MSSDLMNPPAAAARLPVRPSVGPAKRSRSPQPVPGEFQRSRLHLGRAFYLHVSSVPGDSAEWQLVPFFGGRTDLDMFRTREGADCTLSDLRLVRARRDTPVAVIVATSEVGRSFAGRAYCDVSEAFERELGLGRVGLGRGDGDR
jgi:hypothetical protein